MSETKEPRYKPGVYFLQELNGRTLIDDALHDGAVEIARCEAKDWKDARIKLAG